MRWHSGASWGAIVAIPDRETDHRATAWEAVGPGEATEAGLGAIEKLPIKNMTRSAKGTVEQPGSQVTQKAGLNRSILDKGWRAFELALHNVARQTGCRVKTSGLPGL